MAVGLGNLLPLANTEFDIVSLIHGKALTFVPLPQHINFTFGFTIYGTDTLFFTEANHLFQQRATDSLVTIILGNLNDFQAIADTWRG